MKLCTAVVGAFVSFAAFAPGFAALPRGVINVPPAPQEPTPQSPAQQQSPPEAPTGILGNLNGCLLGVEHFRSRSSGTMLTWRFMAYENYANMGGATEEHFLSFSGENVYLDREPPTGPGDSFRNAQPWLSALRESLHAAALSNTVISVQAETSGRVLDISVWWGKSCPISGTN